MVRIWYHDGSDEDQRLPHIPEKNPKFLSPQELFDTVGIKHIVMNADTFREEGVLDKLKKERGYVYEDSVHCHTHMDNAEEELAGYATEHFHREEEIRLVVRGKGYFDVRDPEDKWIRIEVVKNDLLLVPAGMYHRFSLDVNEDMATVRCFIDDPNWIPYNRKDGVDDLEVRKKYLKEITAKYRANKCH
ncbi:hypothetical protein CAPTEDRAFT_110609 [Capitella teleta]|uniref:Acireductone dioxygenase n=1 Tax=Capitella teleta TaxID=283909 RepID=R7TUQ3_CAPTE|nr:hypothetical protein CAPTEDRAFT_110609 [Capitella teleta]|eukprot:ELT95206.1 hypothetical protein CAPTEDRAFT_110609 [Capitella teleta]